MAKTFLWIEDRKGKASYTFWEKLMKQLSPDVIVESKKNNSELVKAVRTLQDAENRYIVVFDLMPRIQNQIRSLAAFDNPEFYKNKRLGYSNYYNFSAVYLGKDIDGYIRVPRGLRERISEECTKAGIPIEISDQRDTGRPIRVAFNGGLRLQQELAAEQLLRHSDGVLEAATAFGKTVVCSYLIAERKVNTLILLQSKDLLSQWVDELNKFLNIREEPPEYETKTGRKKKRDSTIGILHGTKNRLHSLYSVLNAVEVCPVAFEIYERLKKEYGFRYIIRRENL